MLQSDRTGYTLHPVLNQRCLVGYIQVMQAHLKVQRKTWVVRPQELLEYRLRSIQERADDAVR